MAVGDIYKIFVAFHTQENEQQVDGKERYTVEIGQVQLGVILICLR